MKALETGYEPPPAHEPTTVKNEYVPPENKEYEAPKSFLETLYGPPESEHTTEGYHPASSTSNYLPPSITKLPRNYPKHHFNIIIKNKNKPDTSISITPEPPILTVTHGEHKVIISKLTYKAYTNNLLHKNRR